MSMVHPDLLSVLLCPKSNSGLNVSETGLVTADGKNVYPLVSDIPWLFSEPDYFQMYWGSRKQEFIKFHKDSVQKLDLEIKSNTLSALTQKRLTLLKKAHELNAQTLSEILSPISSNDEIPFEVGVPSHQSLHLYRKNLFRDWGWTTDENQTGVRLIKEIIGHGAWKPRRFCVLGAGACRLAMDLHQEFQLPMTVALDFNPLLLLTAQRISQGDILPMYDFPSAPLDIDSVARVYNLEFKSRASRVNAKPEPSFHFLFGDVTQIPLKSKVFNAVLTPWLIDILPFSFKLLAQRVNRILDVGGDWINFGPLGFSHKQESLNLTQDEIFQQLTDCGYLVESRKSEKIKYLSADDEVNSRNESVLLFRARKIRDVAIDPYEYWAPWVLNRDLPIPLTDHLRQHQQLVRFQADLFHSIDGRLSVNQIAKLFAQHYKLDVESAKKMTMNVLRQYEESKKRK